MIKEQVATCKIQGVAHAFEDAMLSRLSSHSCKKTSVTLMKQQGVATTIISMLTGTSCRILDTTYFRPTKRAQRDAQASAFQGITQGLKDLAADADLNKDKEEVPTQPPAAAAEAVHFCVACGRKTRTEWCFCPSCGTCLNLQGL